MNEMSRKKLFYLYKFRRIECIEHLERLVEHMEEKVPVDSLFFFHSAADHRRAELVCKTHFDKVPKSVWYFVH